jgi:outer membrane protein assembly factor BamD
MHLFRLIIVSCLALSFLACSGKAPVKPAEKFDAEKSFTKANKKIDEKEYEDARDILLEIKNRDLSKKYAPLAQLRLADAYVKDDDIEHGISEYKRFLEIYPNHRHAPYAQYQIAMVYFNQIGDPERGSGSAARAIAQFEKLKKDYPRNPYKDIIALRIEKARNIMADYEMLVGEFYMKKGSYDATIGRFAPLLEEFSEYKK